MNSPGLEILQDTTIVNEYHTGGHPELKLTNVRVPVENRLGEEGEGFAVMQKCMGPGRIHYGMTAQAIARSRIEIDQTRLL